MIALIDGDVILYRVGFACKNETINTAFDTLNDVINDITEATQAQPLLALSCPREENFRTLLNPDYKLNRVDAPKPDYFNELKDYMIYKYEPQIGEGEEADDIIGIGLSTYGEEAIACTNDKDILYGLEGNKYNFVKKEQFYTSEEEALNFFYQQLLTGDKVDNIIGLHGVGPKTAQKWLAGCSTEEDMYNLVLEKYEGDEDRILMNGRMLKIRTYEGEVWQRPNSGQKDD